MSPRRRTQPSCTVCVLGALVVLFGAAACKPEPKPEPPSEFAARGVRAFVVKKGDPRAPERVAGDVVIEGPELGVVLQASGRPDERAAVIALWQGDTEHDWESLLPLVAVGPEVFNIRFASVRPAQFGSRVGVIAEGSVVVGQTRIRVERRVRIADVASALRLSTTLEVVSGPTPQGLAVVERVGWGGGFPIAPLSGALHADTPVEAEWVARAVQRRAVVIASLAGRAQVVGRTVDHGRVDLMRFTDVRVPALSLGQRRFGTDTVVSASLGGLGEAVRRLGWVRGRPFREATAMLTANPPDAEVRVVEQSTGYLVSAGLPDEHRRVRLPLPERAIGRDLVVGAFARGREASEWVPLPGPPYAPVELTIPAGASLEVVVRHRATGELLPARIRLVPRKGTVVPDLGPDWAASGALDTVIAPSGRVTIPLPAGYYRVIVTHGPEWTVVDEAIELGLGESTSLEAPLERAVDPGPWVPCELHVHAAPSSDSQVALDDRVASLVAEGIAFAVPTDHNHVTDFSDSIATQPLWGLGSVPGVEVTTWEPAFGHFNAFPYPIDPDAPGHGAPEFLGLTPVELFGSLHALDPELVVQVNHPRLEGGIGYFDVAEFDSARGQGNPLWTVEFDTLEVWNGFDLARRPNVDRVFGEWLSLLEKGHRIVATGSSDSHTIRSEGAGYPRTYIRAPLAGIGHGRDLIRSLRAGHAFVTSGPFLSVHLDGKGPGEEVVFAAGRPATLDIRVQVAHWQQVSTLRVYLGTELLRSSSIGPPTVRSATGTRYERQLQLSLPRPGPLVVTVGGDKPLEPIVARRGVVPYAFTNPIWLVPPQEEPQEQAAPEPVPAETPAE